MNPILAKAWPWAFAILLASSLFAGLVADEREVGRLQVQLASADSTAKAAVADAKRWQQKAGIDSSRAVALEADTARANAKARSLATAYAQTLPALASTRHALDSAMQVAAQHPDSATQPILDALRPYLAHSDSSLHACSDALTSVQEALQACQQQGAAVKAQLVDVQAMAQALAKDTTAKALQFRAVQSKVPSALSTWGWRLASFGLGLLAARVSR